MCGVFGARSTDGTPVLEDVYLGLYALQHRGQESAGTAWTDGQAEVQAMRGPGLVHDALDQQELAEIGATAGIGHVRYSTAGGPHPANMQPLTAMYAKGAVAIAHNGNLTNADALRRYLQGRGAIFQSTSDTETILHLMAHQPHKPPMDALIASLLRLRGAYSLTVMLGDRLVAARDPWGFRPLVLGKRGGVYYAASESCALDIVGAEMIRDVKPGELVIVDDDGLRSLTIAEEAKRRFTCAFEYVYFARPDSVLDGRCIYRARKKLGELLARQAPVPEADFVTGMPDSGTPAAMGFAEGSAIPYEKAIIRNRYVGRTFIQPTQRVRDLGVRIKLNPIPELIEGKSIVVVDDSLVRGTTSRRMIAMIRECRPRAVHLRIASPPVRFPCYYGIDTPTSEELAAAQGNMQALAEKVGADSLEFVSEEHLVEAVGLPAHQVCTACFSGHYMEEEGDHGLEV